MFQPCLTVPHLCLSAVSSAWPTQSAAVHMPFQCELAHEYSSSSHYTGGSHHPPALQPVCNSLPGSQGRGVGGINNCHVNNLTTKEHSVVCTSVYYLPKTVTGDVIQRVSVVRHGCFLWLSEKETEHFVGKHLHFNIPSLFWLQNRSIMDWTKGRLCPLSEAVIFDPNINYHIYAGLKNVSDFTQTILGFVKCFSKLSCWWRFSAVTQIQYYDLTFKIGLLTLQ